MQISAANEENLVHGGDIIRRGGIVAIPTETVYGLAADALNPSACARIFEAKRRPFFDPLICHVSSREMVNLLASSVSPLEELLMKHFWPGPLTIVFPKKDAVPDIVTSGLSTVAVRFPAHPVAQNLIRLSDTPLAAPSANPFGYLSPTKAEHVLESLGDRVDMIIDGGQSTVGVESTIVRIIDETIYILRPGGIAAEDLERLTGVKTEEYHGERTDAPGMLESHYAPRARLVIINEGESIPDGAALLSFKGREYAGVIETLSRSGDLREAAANLFAALHRLDDSGVATIFAERIPEQGLGAAIMNRLQKAAAAREIF